MSGHQSELREGRVEYPCFILAVPAAAVAPACPSQQTEKSLFERAVHKG
jgi:hypothetical protein